VVEFISENPQDSEIAANSAPPQGIAAKAAPTAESPKFMGQQ